MQQPNVWEFLLEFYKRMALKSPKFFQILQTIGMIAAIVTGLPLAIQQFEMFTGIKVFESLPEVVNSTFIRVVFFCGVIVKIMAKLPVVYPTQTNTPVSKSDGSTVAKSEALPYTANVTETKK